MEIETNVIADEPPLEPQPEPEPQPEAPEGAVDGPDPDEPPAED
jgi:hypothetical protein